MGTSEKETPTTAQQAPSLAGSSRRNFLKSAATVGVGAAVGAPAASALGFDFESFLQKNFRELSEDELQAVLDRLERKYTEKYGKEVNVSAVGPMDDVLFGYGLDISRCTGCRRCVHACVEENNQSRDPEIQWIRVLEFERSAAVRGINLEDGNPYYEHEMVPEEGKFYIPIACQHCEDSPCTNVCPTGATWSEPDGIVVIDYDWCIGCRYCIAACPYGARHFNWGEPNVAADDINPDMHILGNQPRKRGVVEKCTFCIQRVREGKYPACHEVCPVGARKFGNLLDPDSEIRYLMKHKRTFVLKAELETKPKFFYFWGTEGRS
ncbi:MAG: 4Fe-4S dicluster domain-containing protein [Deltaproteobacteria bacterium]|nr:4Fe-4S dicluster domain-containing protein [Deltaproteobacteria bacterium]MBW2390134.1 4Fe-4S dicluster domain-containing protein [Deltaproteobacteria bacterium]